MGVRPRTKACAGARLASLFVFVQSGCGLGIEEGVVEGWALVGFSLRGFLLLEVLEGWRLWVTEVYGLVDVDVRLMRSSTWFGLVLIDKSGPVNVVKVDIRLGGIYPCLLYIGLLSRDG